MVHEACVVSAQSCIDHNIVAQRHQVMVVVVGVVCVLVDALNHLLQTHHIADVFDDELAPKLTVISLC